MKDFPVNILSQERVFGVQKYVKKFLNVQIYNEFYSDSARNSPMCDHSSHFDSVSGTAINLGMNSVNFTSVGVIQTCSRSD